MEYKRFLHLMEEPGNTGPDKLSSLQDLIKEFPYFQSAQMLLAKSMQEQQHIRFERQLKLASCYASDRSVLFSLIHKKHEIPEVEFVSNEEEIISPFVLEDKEEITELKGEDIPAIEKDNPFIETVSVKSEPSTNVKHITVDEDIQIPEEIPYAQRYATDPEPQPASEAFDQAGPAGSSGEIISTDPREVLRRRLSEILGNPAVETDVPTGGKEQITAEERIPVVESAESKESVTVVVEKLKVDEAEIPIHEVTDDKESILRSSESQASVENDKKEIVPVIKTQEISVKADPLEKMELEHALEESILTSLEDLPVLEKHEEKLSDPGSGVSVTTSAKIESGSTPRAFSDWLKTIRIEEFGKYEEVHADDKKEESNENVPVASNQQNDRPASSQGRETVPINIEDDRNREHFSGETVISDKKRELIDKFIAAEPKIIPSKVEFYSPVTQAKKSVEEYDDVVSETLARIYRQQGHPLKARFCYEKLSLFYPEKRSYFAALIKEIDEELNSSNQEDL